MSVVKIDAYNATVDEIEIIFAAGKKRQYERFVNESSRQPLDDLFDFITEEVGITGKPGENIFKTLLANGVGNLSRLRSKLAGQDDLGSMKVMNLT